MGVKQKPKQSRTDRAIDQLTAGGYTVIDPKHNAIKTILDDSGKGELSPREVEALCQTAKVVGIDGFTRFDFLPCGCERIYKGMIVGFDHNPQNYTLRVGGIEGVKPCPRHTELIEQMRWKPDKKGVIDGNCIQPNREPSHWDELELMRRLGK